VLTFLTEHIEVVNAALNATMVLIWTVYLQVFLMSHLRQGRNVIHVDLGDAAGARSRCLVTNLGASAIYVQAIVAELSIEGHSSRTRITDRDEISENDVEDPLARTNRGTLDSGQTLDIGSLDDLVRRARIRLGEDWTSDHIDSVTITVVAISGQIDRVVAASKTFSAEHDRNDRIFKAQTILTRQIRPRQTRAEFSRLLRDQPFNG
jgi:hypothetical protein